MPADLAETMRGWGVAVKDMAPWEPTFILHLVTRSDPLTLDGYASRMIGADGIASCVVAALIEGSEGVSLVPVH